MWFVAERQMDVSTSRLGGGKKRIIVRLQEQSDLSVNLLRFKGQCVWNAIVLAQWMCVDMCGYVWICVKLRHMFGGLF